MMAKSEQTTLALGLNSFAELTKYSYSKLFPFRMFLEFI